ncbi:hypothetical protein BHM03_00026082 [Ensete ventricosum]|nr:hypothetical protein BHM03_00026082 [Ensete ventricosum]
MHLSLSNATNNDLLLPSSLIAANAILAAKSYQQRSFAVICLHRSPQQSFTANYLDRGQQQIEHNSSHLSLHTATALLRNSHVHRCPVFLLLDNLFLKCHIKLNRLWVLMQCSLISGYFHDFIEERTMMLKVFLDNDLEFTIHDRKKEQEKDIHMTPTAMMPSISMLALPERDNVFVLRASRVGIEVTLMQDGRLLIHTEASPTLHMRFLKGILIATKFKIWLDIGP